MTSLVFTYYRCVGCTLLTSLESEISVCRQGRPPDCCLSHFFGLHDGCWWGAMWQLVTSD